MISAAFHAVFYDPIYNALVALISFIPRGDVGVAVIVLTVVIRLVLLPLSLSAARTQRAMKELEPRIKELKDLHKGDKEKETLETLALYREARVNPFLSLVTVIVQIPILLALYWVFSGEAFPAINALRLYGFTPVPADVSLEFLGLLSVAGKSLVLAALAGATQFLQARLALAGSMKPSGGGGFSGDFQKAMGFQLTYVFPILIGVISYTTSGAVALYFITTNLVGCLQEWYVERKLSRKG